jgi:hypothetical protein
MDRVSKYLLFLPALILILPACGEDTDNRTAEPRYEPVGTLMEAAGCKTFEAKSPDETQAALDCIDWSYDGAGTLTITHINAALNCCPGTITADIEIAGTDILISEREGDDAEWCHCLCLYDLTYEFSNIQPDVYTVRFEELYLPEGAEILRTTIDLSTETSGFDCLHRSSYPWDTGGTGGDPIALVTSLEGCKSVITGLDAASRAEGTQVCAFGTYDGLGTLSLEQTNAGLNCCLDGLSAGVTVDGDLIEITHIEEPVGGWCDCICLYDVEIAVFNIDPGIYTIRIVEPYLGPEDPIEFEVDLTSQGIFHHCVLRSAYPWNDTSDEEQDRLILKEMYEGIVEYIGIPRCDGGGECRYVGIGSKPCGGPWHYLIYSLSAIDEEVLLFLVERHAQFEDYMNNRYGYNSTCDVPNPPDVRCNNGVCAESLY